jgi:hypothetical protein
MDDFAKLPSQERRLYFEQTAARLGLSAQIIEKDFWVWWTLKQLFAIDGFRDHLTFNVGTTLSKVYRIIERQDMRPMFFREPPTFDQILAVLPDLEHRINESKFAADGGTMGAE